MLPDLLRSIGVSDRRNRTANRVFFQAAARIQGVGGGFDARIEDISWSGVRMRLPRETLGLKDTSGIGAAAATVEHLLKSQVPLHLMRVKSRTLEDLFLELTGHALRA